MGVNVCDYIRAQKNKLPWVTRQAIPQEFREGLPSESLILKWTHSTAQRYTKCSKVIPWVSVLQDFR